MSFPGISSEEWTQAAELRKRGYSYVTLFKAAGAGALHRRVDEKTKRVFYRNANLNVNLFTGNKNGPRSSKTSTGRTKAAHGKRQQRGNNDGTSGAAYYQWPGDSSEHGAKVYSKEPLRPFKRLFSFSGFNRSKKQR